MSAIFSATLPYKVRCSLPDCQKPVNHVFRQEMENGTMVSFCSPNHANEGQSRWQEKLDKNIRLGVPGPVGNEDLTGGDIPEE